MERRRVVVTGMGLVCPVGNTVDEAWKNTVAGHSGIDYITQVDHELIDNHFAGEVKNFDPVQIVGRREARRTDRVTQFAIEASRQAMEDSELEITEENTYEIGCLIGSGIGGIQSFIDSQMTLMNKGHRSVSPLAVPRILIDSSSGKVSMMYNLKGPNFNITTACATGNNCIGEAVEIIRRGQAVAMLAGSTEAALVPLTIASFNNMMALSRRNDDPTKASRPFDLDRDGFVPAEGAGILVLEELDHALARGAKIYAEVVGYGHTSDAYHVTAPMETGAAASKAMDFALRDAHLAPEQIDYINAHGTSTPLNDKSETLAIKRTFGEYAYELPISSTKSVTGHMLGAGSAVEAIFSIQSIQHNFVPPTINLDTADPDCDLNYTPNIGVEHEIKTVMSNSFGFGGHNAVIIVNEYNNNGKF